MSQNLCHSTLPKKGERKRKEQRPDDSMKTDSDAEIAIFTDALKLLPQERGSFLQRRCGRDERLRCKMEALLDAHDHLGNFLERTTD